MQLHQLQPKTRRQSKKRIGRGGKRGKTSGRGHKGQKSRAGNSSVPQMREIIKKLPKLRGHGKNRAKTVNADKAPVYTVNVAKLETLFDTGGEVSPKTLVAAKAVKARGAKLPAVKILGDGDLKKKLTVSDCKVSATAKEKIEKAGGSVL